MTVITPEYMTAERWVSLIKHATGKETLDPDSMEVMALEGPAIIEQDAGYLILCPTNAHADHLAEIWPEIEALMEKQ